MGIEAVVLVVDKLFAVVVKLSTPMLELLAATGDDDDDDDDDDDVDDAIATDCCGLRTIKFVLKPMNNNSYYY